MFNLIYRKVLRLFHMSSTDNRHEIPTGPAPIGMYVDMLKSKFGEDDTGRRMREYKVVSIQLCKTELAVQHEYTSLRVEGEGRTFYLAIERCRGSIVDKVSKREDPSTDSQAEPADNVDDTLSPPASDSRKQSSSSLSSLDKFTKTRDAQDNISPLDKEDKRDETDRVFRILKFTQPIPLYEVAVLAQTIHQINRHYLLFSRNCYFYAGTLIKALETRYEPGEVELCPTGSAELDKQYGLDGKKRRKVTAGAYRNIPIYVEEAVNIVPVLAQFEKDLKAFENTISAAVKAREDAKAAVEDAKAAEARALASEKGKKAAEAKAKAAEEEKKAAEAKAKAADEEKKAAEAKAKAADEEKKAAEKGKKAAEAKATAAEAKAKAAEEENARLRRQLEAARR
ncbi:hypothetical protein M413DRAFT_445456 [Hebeloma cylindrosporum]|uniref:PPPDE domain-containing protein n=1 Tax=Hebeloma cylindrosporum TaxID=76867 RepID=A0A0C3CCW6_HEBCY|nr:hypothetical protein M413DRAFT_445456 [Hebeloma cylindrosporum h7]